MYSARRVAQPRQRTSKPLAKGSRVPVWPTRESLIVLRASFTISCDVGPSGLSMSSSPVKSFTLFLVGRAACFTDFLEQLRDSSGLLLRAIDDETELGDATESELSAEPGSNEARGRGQAIQNVAFVFLGCGDVHVDAGVFEVGADLDVAYDHAFDADVFHFAQHQARDLLFQKRPDSLRARILSTHEID